MSKISNQLWDLDDISDLSPGLQNFFAKSKIRYTYPLKEMRILHIFQLKDKAGLNDEGLSKFQLLVAIERKFNESVEDSVLYARMHNILKKKYIERIGTGIYKLSDSGRAVDTSRVS